MQETMKENGNLAGWTLTLTGNLLVFVGDHGMAILGVVSMIYGIVIQYMTYRLRVREVLIREEELKRGRNGSA